MFTRLWTSEEDEIVRAEYRRGDLKRLAARLGRTRKAVILRARKFGLTYGRILPPELVAELHAAGLCDRDIAKATGFLKRTIWKIRTKLGLRPNRQPMSDETRRKLRDNLKRVQERYGVKSLRELDTGTRARRSAELAGRYGLPADLRPSQVRILLAIVQGPGTAKVICDRIGKAITGDPYHSFNSKYGHGGNHLTDLRHRGLVCEWRPPRDGQRGSRPAVYFATLPALRLMAQGGRHAEE